MTDTEPLPRSLRLPQGTIIDPVVETLRDDIQYLRNQLTSRELWWQSQAVEYRAEALARRLQNVELRVALSEALVEREQLKRILDYNGNDIQQDDDMVERWKRLARAQTE